MSWWTRLVKEVDRIFQREDAMEAARRAAVTNALFEQARTPGFWGPKMTAAMEWAQANGITTHQSPLAFAQAMDAKLGTKGTASLPVEDAAQRWLDAIDSRSSM